MINLLNIILVFLFLIVVPFILGLLTENVFSEKEGGIVISRCFTMGLVIMLAAFLVFAIPMIFVNTSFNTLLYTWTIVIVILLACSLFLNSKTAYGRIKNSLSQLGEEIAQLDKLYKVLAVITLIIIAFQASLLLFKMHIDTDDSRFLAESLEAYENNTMLRRHPINGSVLDFPIGEMKKEIYAPFPFFITALSVLTRLHPTVLAHTVLPVLLIPLAYSIYFLLGRYYFNKLKDTVVFMYVLSIIMLFSFESIYSLGYTLLTIIWQGRSILATIIIPFLWYVLMKTTTENMGKGIYAVLILTTVAGACLSGMGALILPLIGAGFALSYLINNKKLTISIMICLSMIPCGMVAVAKKFLTSIILKLL